MSDIVGHCYHCHSPRFSSGNECHSPDCPEFARKKALARPATPSPQSGLPSDAAERKTHPIGTGVIDYFPDAIAAVAHCSYVGNEQHNPGKPLHWDRAKSQDESDALMRHFVERGTIDSDGVRHSAKVAWRALALLQKEIESSRDKEGADEQ